MSNWVESDFGSYFSNHITEKYLGEEVPKYHILEDPEGEGFVIGVFHSFVGEYEPLEEDEEERLIFDTVKKAKKFVDSNLKGA